MIPAVVHACWFGRGPKPQLVVDCIESWREYLPDFSIRIWTEDDIGIDDPYFHALLKKGKWAFASDYARFWLLDRYGGVWLDTDMEVIRSLAPVLEAGRFVAGYEALDRISCGVLASEKGHPINRQVIVSLLNAFKDRRPPSNIPAVLSSVSKLGDFSGVTVLPKECFYPYNPYDPSSLRDQLMFRDIRENTYAIHHWAATWTKAESSIRTRVLRKLGLYWGLR